jgi:hypothetical protein
VVVFHVLFSGVSRRGREEPQWWFFHVLFSGVSRRGREESQ